MGVGHNVVEFGRAEQIVGVLQPFDESEYSGWAIGTDGSSSTIVSLLVDKTKREGVAAVVREGQAGGGGHPLRVQQVVGRVPETVVGEIVESRPYVVAVPEIHNG